MAWFWVINGRKWKQAFVVAAAFLFALGVVYAERDQITVFAPDDGPKAIYNVPTDEKKIALTFDISWGEERAGPILDVLEQKGIADRVTFFLSSPWSRDHPEIVKRIVKMGAEIGSHGHRHVNYSTLSDEEIRKQIQTAHRILTELTGKPPRLIRLPNGDFDKRVLRIADELGYTVIQWDTDSLDWKNPGVQTIVSRVLSKAHPGDIVLFHASDSCKQTHEALPVIIDELKKRGYRFVTVSELITGTERQLHELN